MQINLLQNLSIDEYHNADGYVFSSSRISDFLNNSPLYYYKKYITGAIPRSLESRGFRIGQAVDTYITGGKDEFDKLYASANEEPKKPTQAQISAKKPTDKTIKLIKNWKAWEAVNKGKTVLSNQDYTDVILSCTSLVKHPFYSFFKRDWETQNTYRADLDGKIRIQCRPDIEIHINKPDQCDFFDTEVNTGDMILVDLKTTNRLKDWVSDSYNNPFYKFGYHRQCGFYQQIINAHHGKKVHPFLWVVETQEPYETALITIPEHLAIIGWHQTHDAIKEIKDCIKNNHWSGVYEEGKGSINLNDFVINKMRGVA